MKQWSIQTCPRSVHPDWSLMSGPSRVETLPCPWCALDTIPGDHPSTVYRKGDELDVTVRVIVQSGYAGTPPGTDAIDHVYIGAAELRHACEEGRVRLVKAAAPTYEAGRIYEDANGALYLYAPNGELALRSSNWFHLATAAWVLDKDIPTADLRPCDVVPREAT